MCFPLRRDLDPVLISPEHLRAALLDEREIAAELYKSNGPVSEPKMSASQLYASDGAFVESKNTTCLSFFNTMDLRIISAEARDWEKYNQCHRKQACEIPIPVLGKWGDLIANSRKTSLM